MRAVQCKQRARPPFAMQRGASSQVRAGVGSTHCWHAMTVPALVSSACAPPILCRTSAHACCKNVQDFYNLADVYLDAVFHPECLTNPQIFQQEGWHYELDDKDKEMEFKGVVFNEMKGVF